MAAAANWPKNFLIAEIMRISSFNPRKNMTIADAKKNWTSGFCLLDIVRRQERKKPKKIPTPPSEAIGVVCSFRASGRSNSFFSFATFIIAGIAKKVIAKATEPVNITFTIQQDFGL